MDHLFRHQYGKMVSILTRVFGLEHLDTIEDAVQDTFISALRSWPSNYPEKPEAWLLRTAKNRVIDLFRKLAAEKKRIPDISERVSVMPLNEVFLKTEVEDSQLRMIFTACNPSLDSRDQISFALKTLSGFSEKEIASSLLLKPETVKKRLQRARKSIRDSALKFEVPSGDELSSRLKTVHETIYLIFNEGFHSSRADFLVREELCGEATRLCKMLLTNQYTATPDSYALLGLFCFQAARLRTKTNADNDIINLREQDRSQWYFPLIKLGHHAMTKAVETEQYGPYHYEAAIAAEHIKAPTYKDTNWNNLLMWYQKLNQARPSQLNLLNIAVIHMQKGNFDEAKKLLDHLDPSSLEQRKYLYYGLLADLFHKQGDAALAESNIDKALESVRNNSERKYLEKKRLKIRDQS